MKKLTVILSLIVFVFSLSTCCYAHDYGFPDELDTFVWDEAGVLSESTEEHIINSSYNLSQQTGGEIIVACVNTTGLYDIADYAYEMFNQWKIGGKSENNGVLLLLSIDEQDYWCLQGEGLERTLSSGKIKLILNEYLEPDFAKGDYDAGVLATYNALLGELESAYGVSIDGEASGGYIEPAEDDYEDDTTMIWIFLVVLLLVLIFLAEYKSVSMSHGRRRPTVIITPDPTRSVIRTMRHISRHTNRRPPTGTGSFGGGFSGGFGSRGGSFGGGFSVGSRGGFGGRSGGGMSRGGGAGRR